MINRYLIEYAIGALLRQKTKTLFLFFTLTTLTFLVTSVLFIANGIKEELLQTADSLPSVTVQNLKGGKSYDIDTSVVDELLTIKGVESVVPRVWGYYFFRNAGVNFTVVGVSEYEAQYKKTLSDLTESNQKIFEENSMVVGQGVKKVLEKNYYKEYFNFVKPDGEIKKVSIAGVWDSKTDLESNDIIVMPEDLLREIFDMEENKATDIVVNIANPEEIDTVIAKIEALYPNMRLLIKQDLKVSYRHIFNYKSGVFLALFTVALFAFFMIVFDKSSGLSIEEKREIGVLKAIGWTVDDVLKEKFYESSIISFTSYIIGTLTSLIFVYIFHAPILRDLFTGYSELKTNFILPFVFDIQTFALVFFISVPVFIAATIIPSWRTATLETDDVIR
ncbi:MAG: FtsX-like permease family protein [Campylobacterales bacterium]|nr:FtsX-like permease family protein [Campylobacterales bacterium]